MSKSTKFFGVLLSVLLVFTSLVFAAPSAGASHFMYEDGWYFQDGTALRKKTYDYLELEVGETMSFYLEHRYSSISRNEWGTTDHSVVSLSYKGYSGQNRCELTALKVGECVVTGYVESYVLGGVVGQNNYGYDQYGSQLKHVSCDQFYIRVVKSRSSRSTSNSTAKKPASTAVKKTVTLKTPQITKIENMASGQKVTWGKVSGAAKYRVFYKKGSKWAKLIDTTATSVVNKVAKSGKKYVYTVRCLSKDGKKYTSGVNSTGKGAVFVGVPKITKIESLASGQKVTWSKMSGAAKYRVLYKKDSKWVKLCDTASTSVVNKVAKSGIKYTYTIRCLAKNGKYNSGINSTGKSAYHIGKVKIAKIENYVSGQGVTWSKVGGAAKYRVFYKKDSKWVKLCDTTATTVVNKIAKAGQKYVYSVRCISSDGKSYTGPMDSTGKGAVFVAAPKIQSFSNVQTGVTIKWSKSSGAAKYRLFFKSGGEWKPLATVAGTSYTHKVKNGNKYTYTVRCMNSAGKYNSGFSRDGWSHTAPKVVVQPTSVSLNTYSMTLKITASDSGTTYDSQYLWETVYPDNATDKTVTWSSSNTSVATVSSAGRVTAKSSGTAYIYATTSNGKSNYCTVTVNYIDNRTIYPTSVSITPSSITLYITTTDSGTKYDYQTLHDTVYPSNAVDKSVTWYSSDPSVAWVTSYGWLYAESVGTATIYAKTANGITGTCTVTVKYRNNSSTAVPPTSLTFNTNNMTLKVNKGSFIFESFLPTNATLKDLTWSSSNTNVAKVSISGYVTGISPGTATITAKTVNGLVAQCTVKVVN